MTEYLLRPPYKYMLLSSSLDLGDIGSIQKCHELNDTWYVSFDLYPDKLPVNIILGFCLPEECTIKVLNKAADKINALLYQAVQMTGIDYLVKHNFTAAVYFDSTENSL